MLQGGSQSDTVSEFTHGFVQSGTKAIQFRATQPGEMRILPSFDYNNHKPDSPKGYMVTTENRKPDSQQDTWDRLINPNQIGIWLYFPYILL